MEQALKNGLGNLLCRHTGVIPSFDNEIDRVLDNGLSDRSSWLVENETEVIL